MSHGQDVLTAIGEQYSAELAKFKELGRLLIHGKAGSELRQIPGLMNFHFNEKESPEEVTFTFLGVKHRIKFTFGRTTTQVHDALYKGSLVLEPVSHAGDRDKPVFNGSVFLDKTGKVRYATGGKQCNLTIPENTAEVIYHLLSGKTE